LRYSIALTLTLRASSQNNCFETNQYNKNRRNQKKPAGLLRYSSIACGMGKQKRKLWTDNGCESFPSTLANPPHHTTLAGEAAAGLAASERNFAMPMIAKFRLSAMPSLSFSLNADASGAR
jgi:hypothetical protein